MRISLILFTLITLTSHARECDTLLYSSGGKSGGELNETRLLSKTHSICPQNVYYGKGTQLSRRDDTETNTSETKGFLEGLQSFVKRDRPVLKFHIAGHGSSTGSLSEMKLSESQLKERARRTTISPDAQRFDTSNIVTSEESKGYIQITNETCLSGNALAQMLGIPLTHPYENFDYVMISGDQKQRGRKRHPKAREVNQILNSTEGKTACGVASSSGHTSVIFPHQGRLGGRRVYETMVDTEHRFKRQNGRAPTPAETEFCALRNRKHPSAPISSSTIYLEQLSHHLGHNMENPNGLSGSISSYLVSSKNEGFGEALCREEPALPTVYLNQKQIMMQTAIQNKRQNLQKNINFLLKRRKFRGVKTFEDMQKLLEKTTRKELAMIKEFERKLARAERRIKAAKDKEINAAKKVKKTREKALYRKYLAKMGGLKQTTEFNNFYQKYKREVHSIVTQPECYKNNTIPRQLPGVYRGDFLNLAEWKISNNEDFTQECREKLVPLEAKFETDTEGLTYIENFITDQRIESAQDRVPPLDEVKSPAENLEKFISNNINLTILNSSLAGDETDDSPNGYRSEVKMGGATASIRQVRNLEDEINKKNQRFRKSKERIEEKFDGKLLKERSSIARQLKSKLDKLRDYQALNSNVRALMALDQLDKHLDGFRESKYANILKSLQDCEHSGEMKVMDSSSCGF